MSVHLPSTVAFMLLTAAAGPLTPLPDAPRPAIQLAQLTIEQRVIIRIPSIALPGPTPGRVVESRGNAVAPPLPAMREVKGPKCLKLGQIRGALINLDNGVTMVTERSEQFRAHFHRSCRPADFYSGFYIEPNKDGEVCAGRDALHARNGSNCGIEKFSKLVPDE